LDKFSKERFLERTTYQKSGKYETTPLDRINNYLKLIKETD
jgi:hypothetical protein